MQNNNVRPMVAAGIMSGVLFIINAINYYIPVIGALASFVLAVPPAILGKKYGVKWATISVVASLILQLILMGPQMVLASLSMAVLGIFFAVAYKKEWGPAKRFLIPSILFPITIAFELMIAVYIMGFDLAAIMNQLLQENLQSQELFLRAQGITGAQLDSTMVIVKERLKLIKYVIPMLVVLSGVILSYIDVRVTDWFFKRFRLKYKPFPRMSQWYMPEWAAYLFILGLIMLYWGQTRAISLLHIGGLNLLVFSGPIIFVEGAALIKYIFESKKWPNGIFYMIIAFSLMIPLGTEIMFITGFTEMLIKYRKKREAKNKISQ